MSSQQLVAGNAYFAVAITEENAGTDTKSMLSERFESFRFGAGGIAVYQLGQYGTAAKKLKEWKIKQ